MISEHEFLWYMEEGEDFEMETKTFSMQVSNLDVRCFAAVCRSDSEIEKLVGQFRHEFSYELSWANCENAPLLYSCHILIRSNGNVVREISTPSVASSAAFPKGKARVTAGGRISIYFNFKIGLQESVKYNSLSMAEVALPLLKENVLSDVEVVCGEVSFNCHKVVLAGRSEVFKKMLTGQYREAGENRIMIRDCDPNVAKLFIEFVYSDYVEEKAVTWKLFDLAKMYDLPRLQKQCLRGFLNNLNVDNCSEMLEAAYKYDLDNLFNQVMDFFKENKPAVAKTEGWKAVERNQELLVKIALHPYKKIK